MAKNKTIAGLALIAGLGASLLAAGCSSNQEAAQKTLDNETDNDKISPSQDKVSEQLTINASRCSGCGRCVRIAPEYFTWNNNTRRAEVSARIYDKSDKVLAAIAACRDRAINFE